MDECEANCRLLYLPGVRQQACFDRCRDRDRLVPTLGIGFFLGVFVSVLVALVWLGWS